MYFNRIDLYSFPTSQFITIFTICICSSSLAWTFRVRWHRFCYYVDIEHEVCSVHYIADVFYLFEISNVLDVFVYMEYLYKLTFLYILNEAEQLVLNLWSVYSFFFLFLDYINFRTPYRKCTLYHKSRTERMPMYDDTLSNVCNVSPLVVRAHRMHNIAS